jgi:hypothetical protein
MSNDDADVPLGDLLGMNQETIDDYSTADLIAELEKRRPCPRCAHRGKPLPRCCGCLWCGVNGKDNFKPSK